MVHAKNDPTAGSRLDHESAGTARVDIVPAGENEEKVNSTILILLIVNDKYVYN